MDKNDRRYFELAMIFARIAFAEGIGPRGAVLVSSDGNVFSASARREEGNTHHAELLVLTMCQNEPVCPTTPVALYSVLEPCIMCAGMAAVMRVKHITWLVDDLWAGGRAGLNFNSPYIQKRWPTMDKVEMPELHREATEMWLDYLERTGELRHYRGLS